MVFFTVEQNLGGGVLKRTHIYIYIYIYREREREREKERNIQQREYTARAGAAKAWATVLQK